jgi:hypothetical protein
VGGVVVVVREVVTGQLMGHHMWCRPLHGSLEVAMVEEDPWHSGRI